MLENCLSDGQVMASQLSAGPQAAWSGSVGHRQGLPGCRCQHPSIQKHRRLAALDPYGQMDTLCKAKVLHLRPAAHLGHPASAQGGPGALSPPA